MRYREFRPSPRLQPFLESCWTLEHDGEGSAPQRVVPDGHPELILNLRRPFEYFRDGIWHGQPLCFLAGQIEGPLLLRPVGPARILGIRFQPHGAAMVLGAPMQEFAGCFIDVDDLSPVLARDLNQALESANPIAAVEAALWEAARLSRFRDAKIPDAVRKMSDDRGSSDLMALARESGLSLRQFERRFHSSVGLPPKLFCRMQRFNHIFRIMAERTDNWAGTAVACGYFDQSHLIRDFRCFAGEAPSVLLAEETDLARHFLQRFGVSYSYKTVRSPSR